MQPSHPLTDQSDGRAVLQGRNGRPLPCSFLPGTVADLGQQVRAVRVPVLEDVGRDLDEEGVQLCLVPVFKSLRAARVTVKKDTLLLIYTHACVHTYIYIYVCTHTYRRIPRGSPWPSRRGPCPGRPSSGDRPRRSAACRRTRCRCGPFSQSAPRLRLRPAEARTSTHYERKRRRP